MSKKCPNPQCGSTNTSLSVSYGLRVAARTLAIGGSMFLVGLFNRSGMQVTRSAMTRNTEGWTQGVKRYRCHDCGLDFD